MDTCNFPYCKSYPPSFYNTNVERRQERYSLIENLVYSKNQRWRLPLNLSRKNPNQLKRRKLRRKFFCRTWWLSGIVDEVYRLMTTCDSTRRLRKQFAESNSKVRQFTVSDNDEWEWMSVGYMRSFEKIGKGMITFEFKNGDTLMLSVQSLHLNNVSMC